ncbi:MAG: branched-chain amino acid transport system II carrier protein [Myxococcales bacterium]|nr:branched-chain amino acid transport system II carrier protein [Myxococcales bacterium]USN51876.1 MAG: branched-chain amino acid transport system II carrier protein [Myxococcales bacterium]
MKEGAPTFVVIGLALFSMFFGSGNLIYPLMLGRDAGSSFLISAFGFILSAVLIPCLGVVAIAFAQGDYEAIFKTVFPKKLSLALIFLVLLSFIPFGAGPRCVVLAHASLQTFFPMPPLWIFSVCFLSAAVYLINDRSHLVDNLGKILTPLLLLSVAIMVSFALINGHIDPPLKNNSTLFKESLFEGYNTQDLLSSLFFSSSLIMLIKSNFESKREIVLTTLKGSLVAITLLTSLYVSLIAAASFHNDILIEKNGIELVSILAKHTLGSFLGPIAGLAVALACFTTAIALILALSEFIQNHFLKKQNKNLSLLLSTTSVFLTSLLKFEGIMAIISPVMMVIYPLIVFIVLVYLWQTWRSNA